MTKEELDERIEIKNRIRDLQHYFEKTKLSYHWNSCIVLMIKKLCEVVFPSRNMNISLNQQISEWMELMAFCEMYCGILYQDKCETAEEDSQILYGLFRFIREKTSGYFKPKQIDENRKLEKSGR